MEQVLDVYVIEWNNNGFSFFATGIDRNAATIRDKSGGVDKI